MRQSIETQFTLGGAAAEHDPYLLDAFIENGTYNLVKSRTNPECFVIGRTGSGKSATFRLLEHECQGKVIRIAPEDLAMTYITNLDVMPRLLGLGVQLDPFLKALWKHVFIVEILRHRYAISTPDQKESIITRLRERFKKDPGKVAAVDYLSEFGDRFWCETHERVQQIATTFEQKFAAAGGLDAQAGVLGAKGSVGIEQAEKQEIHTELVGKYQRIVNEVQIPRLNKMVEILNDEILDPQHYTYIVIDDLDKEWIDDRFVILLIRNLSQAVIDMKRVRNLKILVALRTNIFHQLGYGDTKRREQEEKLRDFTLEIRWDVKNLRRLLARRAEVASQRLGITPPLTLDEILIKPGKRATIDPVWYILSRTLLRPRDAILFLNACLREAVGETTITMDNIYQAEKRYSEERLIALRDEWRDPYLDIDKVFEQFRNSPSCFPRSALTETLHRVAELLADRGFRGEAWLEPICENIWSAGSDERTWTENYGPLTRLLYSLGFLGVVKFKSAGKVKEVVYSYEDPNLLAGASTIVDTTQFEIHPAFQQALHVARTEGWYD